MILKKYYQNFLAFIYFFSITVIITYPLIFHLTNHIGGKGDELLITWIINWNIHALLHHPLEIFNANIFYPYKNTLAFSETFFTSSLIALIPIWIFKEPVLGYNINMLFCIIFTGFFTYLFLVLILKDKIAALVGGTLVSFSTYTISQITVIHLTGIEWIPLGLYFYYKYVKDYEFKYFLGMCLCFLLQMCNSFLTGYFYIFTLAAVFLFTHQKMTLLRSTLKLKHYIAILITITLTILVITPYVHVAKFFHYTRDIRDSIHFANRLEYILYPSPYSRLSKLLIEFIYATPPGKYIYFGYLGGMLFLTSGVSILYGYILSKKKSVYLSPFLLLSLVSFILSLGPALQFAGHVIKKPFLIPLPYAVAYYVLPGFKGMRNSSRWEMLTVFSLAVLSAIVFSMITRKRKYLRVIVGFTICFLVLVEIHHPVITKSLPTYKEFPQVYSYISSLPGNEAIIEMPLYSWFMSPYSSTEFMREYYSTRHFHPMVNGYSGFSPKEWEARSLEYQYYFPDKKTISYLMSINVKYIIIHKAEYDELERNNFKVNNKKIRIWTEVSDNLRRFKNIELIKRFGDDYVYKIT